MKSIKKKVKKESPNEFRISKSGDKEFIVQVSEFNDELGVDAREYYDLTEGNPKPTKKGLRMTSDQAREVANAILSCAYEIERRDEEEKEEN